MEHRVSILFYGKKKKITKEGKLPIYLRITINGVRLEHSIHRFVEAGKWSSATGRMKGSSNDARILNIYLDALSQKVRATEREMIQEGILITFEAFKEKWSGASERPRMILEIFQEHNDRLGQLVGKDYEPATLERYKTSKEHTASFIRWKYKTADIDIKKLDFEFISDYEYWLKTQRNCAHNTAMKYLSNFKKIVNICLDRGWLQRNPFAGYKMSKREVERDFLTKEELQAIAEKPLLDRLAQVRDIFLFSCFTGLAYADVGKLRRSEVGVGVDGGQWIFTHRQKTKTASRIPILPAASTIIELYKDHPQCLSQDRVLPVLSNQKMNAYLKEIADVCHITKNLTFHVARHTFATTVTLSNGVPIESVSKMLGHKNLKTTQHYAKILDIKVSADMHLLRQKLGG